MKIILSRKGFDSQSGGQASPILPDGTLLSLPIPSIDGIRFSEIHYDGLSYLDIIKMLNPKNTINKMSTCHLDPDLRQSIYHREHDWTAAFGQTGASLTELRKYNISVGDIFLFFGWFKQTELHLGQLRYKSSAPDLHVIYGYLQIGRMIECKEDIPHWLLYHPHANMDIYDDAWSNHQNIIFLPSEKLSINENLKGYGTFKFKQNVVLTKPGYTRSRWQFPKSMQGIPISHNPNGWKEDYFQSVGRGQEFILDCNESVHDWLFSIFK